MKILGIIPARYDSTRLPGKALAMIGDKPMVQLVFEQASKSGMLTDVVIATDDRRIEQAMLQQNIPVLMTSPDHRSGTERCNEALAAANKAYDYVINIQGDEPFIDPAQIDTLAALCDGNAEIVTLLSQLHDAEELHNPNVVKVVRDKENAALYFSRSPIPYLRGSSDDEWTKKQTYWKHIGMYGYRSDILPEISNLSPGDLEQAESLEQLRWLEYGFSILTGVTELSSIGVDTPNDLEKARILWEKKHNRPSSG